MKNKNGFTLVEVMVASLLFAGIMLYGLSFLSLGQKPMSRSDETNFALQLAEDDLEEVRILGWGNVPEITSPGEEDDSLNSVKFFKTRAVVPCSSPHISSTLVRCTVTWTSPGETTLRTISLVTFVSYTGPWQI